MVHFNLLDDRMRCRTDQWAFGSEFIYNRRSWLALFVRQSPGPAHYQIRKVKGVLDTVYN